jgi:hypothetical protein
VPVFARECAYLILFMSLAARCSHSILQDRVQSSSQNHFSTGEIGMGMMLE